MISRVSKYIMLSALILIIGAAFSAFRPAQTEAQGSAGSDPQLVGWSWSSNIGWICFSGSTVPDCPGARVTFSPASGAGERMLSGWAWSNNIGWIKFGGLSSLPAGGTNAKYDPANGRITGFVRACAGTVNEDCNSATRTDGWDGWISLGNLGDPRYGLKVDLATKKVVGANALSYGWAWGSTVVGWIRFDDMKVEGELENPGGQCAFTDINGSSQVLSDGQSLVVPDASCAGRTHTYSCACTSGTCSPSVSSAGTACVDDSVASCTLPGSAVPPATLPSGETAVRYSRNQVRAGLSCSAFRASLVCRPGSGEEASVLGFETLPVSPASQNVADYVYSECRPLPSYIES